MSEPNDAAAIEERFPSVEVNAFPKTKKKLNKSSGEYRNGVRLLTETSLSNLRASKYPSLRYLARYILPIASLELKRPSTGCAKDEILPEKKPPLVVIMRDEFTLCGGVDLKTHARGL